MAKQRFEFIEGQSRRFWEIGMKDTKVTVCFGRIGTTEQTQTKSLDPSADSAGHVEKLIAAKHKKGYREVVCR